MPRKRVAKRSPGRPPRTDDPKRVTVLLPGTLKRRLRLRAIEEGRDMGDIVADAMREYLRRRAKGRGGG
jgi:hypothetical protein